MIAPDKRWRDELTSDTKLKLALAATGLSMEELMPMLKRNRLKGSAESKGVLPFPPMTDKLLYLLSHVDLTKDIYGEGVMEIYPGSIDASLERFRYFSTIGDKHYISTGEVLMIALTLAEHLHKEILQDPDLRSRMKMHIRCTYNVTDDCYCEVEVKDIREPNEVVYTIRRGEDGRWALEVIAVRQDWRGKCTGTIIPHVVTDRAMCNLAKQYVRFLKPDLDLRPVGKAFKRIKDRSDEGREET